MGEHPDHEGAHTDVYEEAPGNPPAHCDHRPPKVAALPADGGVRVRCLGCGTVGPERATPGEAFRALLKILYRANRSDINSTCVVANHGMKGARGAFREPHSGGATTAVIDSGGFPARKQGAVLVTFGRCKREGRGRATPVPVAR